MNSPTPSTSIAVLSTSPKATFNSRILILHCGFSISVLNCSISLSRLAFISCHRSLRRLLWLLCFFWKQMGSFDSLFTGSTCIADQMTGFRPLLNERMGRLTGGASSLGSHLPNHSSSWSRQAVLAAFSTFSSGDRTFTACKELVCLGFLGSGRLDGARRLCVPLILRLACLRG